MGTSGNVIKSSLRTRVQATCYLEVPPCVWRTLAGVLIRTEYMIVIHEVTQKSGAFRLNPPRWKI